MKKSFVKEVCVVLFAAISLGVVLGGSYFNSKNQYQQRVEYAQEASITEKEKLAQIDQEIQELFAEEGSFFKHETSAETIQSIRKQLTEMHINATDYNLKTDEMPIEMQELAKERQVVDQRLAAAEQQMNLQEAAAQLFTTEIKDWQKTNELVVAETVQQTTVDELRKQINALADSEWQTVILNVLDQADNQVAQASDLKSRLNKYLEEPMTVTYQEYLDVSFETEQVANQEIYKRLRTLIKELAVEMNL